MVVTTRRNLVTAVIFFLVIALVATFVYSKQAEHNRGIIPSQPTPAKNAGTAGSTVGSGTAALAGQDFFVDYRLERERIRSQQMEMLREIISNAKADDQSRKAASDRWLALTEELGQEMELENLVKAKGFEDALVFLQSSTAVVIIKAKDLNAVESSRVMDVVRRGTGIKPENINVMTKPR